MFVIATYYPAESAICANHITLEYIFDILTHICITAFAGDTTYTPRAPTHWNIRNALGRIVGAGESGLFTTDLCDIVKEQLHHMPLYISFDNGMYYEIMRADDYE
jgi:hypothetical protein